MGGTTSAFSYDEQLIADRGGPYSIEVPDATAASSSSSSSDSASSSSSSPSSETPLPAQSIPRRNPNSKDGLSQFPYPNEKDVNSEGGYRTLWEIFQRGVVKNGDGNCLGTRVWAADQKTRGDFVWQSYREVDTIAREIGNGLITIGCKPGDENVGLFAANRAEWMQTALGLFVHDMRVVALYDTLGAEAVEYIANHAELRVVFTQADKVPHLLKVLPKISGLTHIVQFDVNEKFNNKMEAVKQEHVDEAASRNVKLIGLEQLREAGRAATTVFPTFPKASELCMVMYTSGTTGNPKGVILTHGNLAAAISTVRTIFDLGPNDRHLSYLPLAHIFEFAVEFAMVLHGGGIGYFQNNIRQLTNDWLALHPTILVGVPRVFNRMYSNVFGNVANANFVKRWYFNKAYAAQCNLLRQNKPRDAGYDNKVFNKIRQMIGLDKVKGIITGAAPCPPYLQEFLKVVIGCPVMQGYGMTETSAAISIPPGSDHCFGHCGGPVGCVEVVLRDVPDMGYFAAAPKDGVPRGEVCVRGPGIFTGYYKDVKATGETIDAHGWMMTGDIGRWNPNGSLSIIDRKKNMFKLSNGEYIAAEKVEVDYGKSPLVGQIWVYGNSFKSFLLAVVVPNAENIYRSCLAKGWWPRSEAETKVASDEFSQDIHAVLTGPHAAELKAEIVASMQEHEKTLKAFERVTDIIIEPNINNMLAGFTEQNSCLTPTFKLRRPQLLQRYIKQLKETYGKNGEPVGADEKWPGEA